MFGGFAGDETVVSIVGAGSPDNMGQVMARRFAESGTKVAVSGRRTDVLQQLADDIGGDWVERDPCDRDSVAGFFAIADKKAQRYRWRFLKVSRPSATSARVPGSGTGFPPSSIGASEVARNAKALRAKRALSSRSVSSGPKVASVVNMSMSGTMMRAPAPGAY